jgi:hypothetical protein
MELGVQRHRLLGTRGCNPIGAWSELTAASILHRGGRSTDDPCTLHRQSQVRAVCECLRRGTRRFNGRPTCAAC